MKHLVDNYILPFTDDLERITSFRDCKLIFMKDVSVLLDANIKGISFLYNHFKEKGFNTKFSLKSAIDMVSAAKMERLIDNDLLSLVYGASKAVVIDESNDMRQY